MNKLLDIIRQHKKICGKSTAQLSKLTNIPLGTLTKILSGTTKSIKAEHLQSIAHALNIDNSLFADQHIQDNNTNLGYIKVASTTIDTSLANPTANGKAIIARILELHAQGVHMICFAELAITGYSCGDLLYSHTLLDSAMQALGDIILNTAHLDILYAVGMPLMLDSRLYNTAVVIHKGKILAVVPKTNLPNYNEFAEKRLFYPAPSGTSTITLLGQEVLFGTDIIITNDAQPNVRLCVEICEDIWVATPPSSRHTDNGANIVFNLSASNDWAGKSDYRRMLVTSQSAKCVCGYVYASAGRGESTGDTVFGGHNIVAEYGNILSETELFTTGSAIAELDTHFIDSERNKRHNLINNLSQYSYVHYHSTIHDIDILTRHYTKTPFVMGNAKKYADTVLQLASHALAQRLSTINCQHMILGISGGLDSSMALLTCCVTADLLGIPRSNILCYSMPCYGTTIRTKNNSLLLPQALGATVTTIDITRSVDIHLANICHRGESDTTLENAQARTRTHILMDMANMHNGIVIGTGNMSEIALGYSTYNGDHMSMYNVNASIPKTVIRLIIAHQAKTLGGQVKDILLDILNTPVSAELLPTKGEVVQQTENIIGPYELHDFFLYCIVACNHTAKKTLFITYQTWGDKYSLDSIYQWLCVFIRRFFSQQFKRNASPDGAKVTCISLSTKSDWRMPADANCDIWLSELDTYYHSISNH